MLKKILFITIVLLIPVVIIVNDVLSGGMALWYDNARDLLSAWDNLSKLTMIGPTSGIPGIFYGPYWIWLLSIGLIFSKDPRIVTLIVQTIPYLVFFPLVLYKFRSYIGLLPLVIVWLLFIFTIGMKYATGLWNPYLAPLMFLFLVYLIMKTEINEKGLSGKLNYILIGIIGGLIINFHISFGIGVFLGIILFLIVEVIYAIRYLKTVNFYKIISILINPALVFLGLAVSFLPSIIFEIRHGFNQIQVISNTFIKYGDVVTVSGLTKMQILEQFFGRAGQLLNLDIFYSYLIQAIILFLLAFLLINRKIIFNHKELRLLKLLLIFTISILFIYLTARNPVWGYHFIGTEIIFLLLIAIIIKKSIIFKSIFLAVVFILLFNVLWSFSVNLTKGNSKDFGLNAQKQAVELITTDASGKGFGFFAYSPSIYIYEYSYLFRWLYGIDVSYDPGNMTKNQQVVYLIMPNIKKGISYDFIKYRTPDKLYKTEANWVMKDGAELVKRVRIE